MLVGDEFGAAVARRIGRTVKRTVIAVGDATRTSASWPDAEGYLSISATEDARSLSGAEELCRAWRRRWAPLMLTPDGVRLGPVAEPGQPGCYECFLRRRLQHDPYATAEPGAVTTDDWLPSDELVAAGLAEAFCAGEVSAGDIAGFNGADGTLSRDRLIGVHACVRCAPVRDRAGDTWQQLARDLADFAVRRGNV